MSNHEEIIIAADLDVEEVLEAILRFADSQGKIYVEATPALKYRAAVSLHPAINVTALLEPEHSREVSVELYGIDANLVLTFYHDIEHHETYMGMLFNIILEMLSKTDWDFVFEITDPVAIRKAEQFTVKRGHYFWTPERLQQLSVPYELKDVLYLIQS
jgi:hypothetical protein